MAADAERKGGWPSAERRAQPRKPCDLPAAVQVTGRRGAQQARAFDINERGMGLLLGEPVDPGTYCRVSLHRPDGSVLVSLPARVVWCGRGPAGAAAPYLAGLFFGALSPEARAAVAALG